MSTTTAISPPAPPTPDPTTPPSEKKPLTGTLKKTKKNKAPQPQYTAPTAPTFNPAYYAEQLDAWWLEGSGYYVRRQHQAPGETAWKPLNRRDFEMELRHLGCDDRARPAMLSEVEQICKYVMDRRTVQVAMNLAGHNAGIYVKNQRRILILDSPKYITPKKGNWDTLNKLFTGMFSGPIENPLMPLNFLGYLDSKAPGRQSGRQKAKDIWKTLVYIPEAEQYRTDEQPPQHHLDQRPIFYTWLRLSLEAYITHRAKTGAALQRNAQMLILAGDGDSGKGLLQNWILTPLLGGRASDPAKLLFQGSTFNKNMFGCEHACTEEMPTDTSMKARLLLLEIIKGLVTKPYHMYEPKGVDAISLDPVWRHTLSVNSDSDALRALPPVNNNFADKIHLIHVRTAPMPVDTSSHEKYEEFKHIIAKELPAFAHYLLKEFEIPECLRGGRFGMLAYQAPDLVKSLFEDTPAGSLIDLLNDSRWGTDHTETLWHQGSVPTDKHTWIRKAFPVLADASATEITSRIWIGKAQELQAILTNDENTQHKTALEVFKHSRIERLLSRLAQEDAAHIQHGRTNTERWWAILRPAT